MKKENTQGQQLFVADKSAMKHLIRGQRQLTHFLRRSLYDEVEVLDMQ